MITISGVQAEDQLSAFKLSDRLSNFLTHLKWKNEKMDRNKINFKMEMILAK